MFMCGRLDLSESPQINELFERLQLPLFPPSYNVAPTDTVPVIIQTDQLELRPMRWWLTPSWAPEPTTKYPMFNARAESITSRRAFSDSFKRRRCVIPVAGFYEWQKGKEKQPYKISAINTPMLLGGIWDSWQKNNALLESFAIITTEAAPEMTWLHDRQPILIPEFLLTQWLDSNTPVPELGSFLLPNLPYALQATPVSSRMNNARVKVADEVVGDAVVMGD
jgi:putative SOS response-associated peptidase YedK